MKKIQSVLKSFSITPKGQDGDYNFKMVFCSQEGPGILEELLNELNPLLNKECLLKIEPVQMQLINKETGEVK